MYIEKNFIDYGIYIDHKEAFIISLNHLQHEKLIKEEVEKNHTAPADASGSTDFSREKQLQNRNEEHLKKFCKSIVAKLDKAHRILIFGPSTAKLDLQREILNTKSIMLHVKREELLATEQMTKEEALRFVNHHFSSPFIPSSEK